MTSHSGSHRKILRVHAMFGPSVGRFSGHLIVDFFVAMFAELGSLPQKYEGVDGYLLRGVAGCRMEDRSWDGQEECLHGAHTISEVYSLRAP